MAKNNYSPSGNRRILFFFCLLFPFVAVSSFPRASAAWLGSGTERQLEELLYRFGSPLPSGARPYRLGELKIILEDLQTRELSPYAEDLVNRIHDLNRGVNRIEVTGISGSGTSTRLHDEGIVLRKNGLEVLAQIGYSWQDNNDISVFLEPSWQTGDYRFDLHRGEMAIEKWNMQLSAGKNRLFWGHGHHTSLMFSDRSEPLPQIQIASVRPFRIPYLPFLGRVKPRLIYSRLDETDRSLPGAENFGFTESPVGRDNPSLWGLRVDFYYSPNIEWSAGRVTMFGGDGTTSGYSLGDWLHTLFGSDHLIQEPQGQSSNGKTVKADSNGLLFIEIKGRFPGLAERMNWEGITAYIDMGADDLRHDLVSSINLPRPAAKGFLYGIRAYPDKNSSWIFEYSEAEDDFFRFYQHTIFKGGHSYKGRWLGHILGSDAESYFIRYNREQSIFGLVGRVSGEIFRGKTLNKRYSVSADSYVPSEPREMKVRWGALEAEAFVSKSSRLAARLQLEQRQNDAWRDKGSHLASLMLQLEIGF